MALTLTDLPLDVLTVLSLHLQVEDVLTLMQTCRVMHTLGSSDYVWHTLLSDWDVPLDIPENISFASLSSDSLRLSAVKSLRLDNKWRNPRREMRRAQCIIPRNSSFVDGMRFLPSGHYLVTLQYEQTPRTHVTLWTITNSNEHRSIFRLTVPGRVRCLHTRQDHNQVMIGIASVHRTADAIRVYSVSLQDDVSPLHSLVFKATPDELDAMGEVADMKINGDIMFVVFIPPSPTSTQAQIVCVNLVSRATVVLDCPDWPLGFIACTRFKVFRQHFAIVTSRFIAPRTATSIFFHELPPVILDQPDCLSSSVPRWPEKLKIQSLPVASTSWSSDYSSTYELSDDSPTRTACSFTMFWYPMAEVKGVIEITYVSFDGKNIEFARSAVECRSTPSSEKIRVSPSGRRAVWLTLDDTEEHSLERFAAGRDGTKSCSSILMPSFSGLPFNPRDFHSFVFDELSCRMAVGLPTGELYILHFD